MKKAYPTQQPTGKHLGGLTISRVVHEHHPLTTTEDGHETLGNMFDDIFRRTLEEGATVQDVAFHFDTQDAEAMRTLAAMYRVLR